MFFRGFLSRALVGRSCAFTAPLQGLRTLACISTVVTHVQMYSSIVLDDVRTVQLVDVNASWIMRFIYNILLSTSIVSVDIFFFISGFFFAETVTRASGNTAIDLKQNITVTTRLALRHLLNRWLRLAPVLICALLMGWIACDPACLTWSQFFLLNRLPLSYGQVHSMQELCLPPSWSLNIDIQVHAAMLLLLVLLPTWKSFCQTILILVCLQPFLRAYHWISSGRPRAGLASLAFLKDIPTLESIADMYGLQLGNYSRIADVFVQRAEELKAYNPIYYNVEFRYAGVMIGVLTWYAMKQNLVIVQVIRNHANASFLVVATVWIFCMHASYLVDLSRESGYTTFLIVHEALGRIIISAAVAIVTVLTVDVGKSGLQREGSYSLVARSLRSVLANPVLVALSRTTYATYLVHLFVMPVGFFIPPKFSAKNYTIAVLLISSLQVYCCTLFIAAPLAMIEQLFEPVRKHIVLFIFPQFTHRNETHNMSRGKTPVKQEWVGTKCTIWNLSILDLSFSEIFWLFDCPQRFKSIEELYTLYHRMCAVAGPLQNNCIHYHQVFS